MFSRKCKGTTPALGQPQTERPFSPNGIESTSLTSPLPESLHNRVFLTCDVVALFLSDYAPDGSIFTREGHLRCPDKISTVTNIGMHLSGIVDHPNFNGSRIENTTLRALHKLSGLTAVCLDHLHERSVPDLASRHEGAVLGIHALQSFLVHTCSNAYYPYVNYEDLRNREKSLPYSPITLMALQAQEMNENRYTIPPITPTTMIDVSISTLEIFGHPMCLRTRNGEIPRSVKLSAIGALSAARLAEITFRFRRDSEWGNPLNTLIEASSHFVECVKRECERRQARDIHRDMGAP